MHYTCLSHSGSPTLLNTISNPCCILHKNQHISRGSNQYRGCYHTARYFISYKSYGTPTKGSMPCIHDMNMLIEHTHFALCEANCWWSRSCQYGGGQHLKPPKFEHIFVAVITCFLFLLYKYFDTSLLLIVCALR